MIRETSEGSAWQRESKAMMPETDISEREISENKPRFAVSTRQVETEKVLRPDFEQLTSPDFS